jgi:hypothetical protein
MGRKDMNCKLCQENKPLQDSHIIPKFVARWLKKTSATGYLRQATKANIRKQDLGREKLLCKDCETLFSNWETQFSQRIFFPYQDNNKREFDYEEWLQKFAISLSWRAGIVELEGFRRYKPHLVHHLETSLEIWREFLLGAKPSQDYAHNLLFLDIVESVNDIRLPDGFHGYVLRATDLTIPANDSNVFVYVKLPSMVFLSGVVPNQPAGWKNTEIFESAQISASNQVVSDGIFGEFFLDRAFQGAKLMNHMSDKQKKKITDDISSDPSKSLQSNSFIAVMADRYWKEKNT